MTDWRRYADLGCKAGTTTAAEVRRWSRRTLEPTAKAAPWDLVTAADKAAQDVAVSVLRAGAPDIPIVGEEGADERPTAGLWWLVDPIDGTTNFIHGLPYYAVSIALIAEDTPVVGVVVDPVRREVFAAAAGSGAFRGKRRIRVDTAASLDEALVSSRIQQGQAGPINLAAYGRIANQVRSMRNMGAAALELAHVACGRLSGYWEMKLNPWDFAAGAVLVQEAGGRVSRTDGQPLHMREVSSVLASNSTIYARLREELQGS